jgi:hypothetical protein
MNSTKGPWITVTAGVLVGFACGLTAAGVFSAKSGHASAPDAPVESERDVGEAREESTPVPDSGAVSKRTTVETNPVTDSPGIATLESELLARDTTIRSLLDKISALEGEIAIWRAEGAKTLVSEFLMVAAAEGIEPDAANILAERIIPKLGEIPDRLALKELAVAAAQIFPKLDAARLGYTGDPDDPEQMQRWSEIRELYKQWNQVAERALGFDLAKKVRWGS